VHVYKTSTDYYYFFNVVLLKAGALSDPDIVTLPGKAISIRRRFL